MTIRHRADGTQQRQIIQVARALLPGGSLGSFYLPEDVDMVIARGAGSHIWDLEGREYVDWLLGAGSLILGHAHPQLVSAVGTQLQRGSTFYALNEPAIQLAETLVGAIPGAEQVKFAADGTGATFFALRLARAYTGRTRIVRFEGGYHGYHDYAMFGSMAMRVPDPLPDFPLAAADSAGIPDAIADTVLTVPFNDLETTDRVLREFGTSIAAVIVEPLQRAIPPLPSFLQMLRERTRSIGALLIFDEVVTGFRLAWGGAQEFYGVTADLACFGKAVAGGFPIGVVAGPRDILKLANPRDVNDRYAFCTGTFSGNPLSAAAGNATLEILHQPGVYERLHELGGRMRDTVRKRFREAAIPCQVLGDGPIFSVVLADHPVHGLRDTLDEDRTTSRRLLSRLIANGMLCSPKKGYASLVHTESDVRAFDAALLIALEEARSEVRAGAHA